MLVTEKEAEKLGCMEARVHSIEGNIGINAYAQRAGHGFEVKPLMMCIGAKCMAWRWHDASTVKPSIRRGYCGKAGEAKL